MGAHGDDDRPGSQHQDKPLPEIVDDEIEHDYSDEGNINHPPTPVKDIAIDPEAKDHKEDDNEDLSSVEDEGVSVPPIATTTIFGMGDVVWCRSGNSCYYPAVVVNDTILKNCTKIVMPSDPSSKSATRQYCVSMLEDRRVLWVDENHCFLFTGLVKYEGSAVQDAANMKFYKPKPDQLLTWRQCVAHAEEFLTLNTKERVKRLQTVRLPSKVGFLEEPQNDTHSEHSPATDIEKRDLSPMKEHNSFPSKHVIEKDKSSTKSSKDETNTNVISTKKQTNQNKDASHRVPHSTGEKVKSGKMQNSPQKDKKIVEKDDEQMFIPVFHSNVKFSKSFKIKKTDEHKDESTKKREEENVKEEEEKNLSKSANKEVIEKQKLDKDINKEKRSHSHHKLNEKDVEKESSKIKEIAKKKAKSEDSEYSTKKEQNKEKEISEEEVQPKSSSSEHVQRNDNLMDTSEPLPSASRVKTAEEPNVYEEGSLVWARMRGYPYWPAIVSRDPIDGEFLKIADTIYKNFKRFHVLFLEYGNQRAWIGASSIKPYKGLEKLQEEKKKASKKAKADYQVSKKLLPSFNKAVDYAEDLVSYSDEERLEKVLLNYGWNEVDKTDPAEDTSTMEEVVDQELNSTFDSSTSSDKIEPAEAMHIDGIDGGKGEMPESAKVLKRDHDKVENDVSEPEVATPVNKKRKQNNDKVVKVPQPADPATPNKSISEDNPDFPLVGDLVWGRMPGFPFWPSFITRNPENQFKREKNGKAYSFHVQFFGWNDESGWASSVLPFNGMDAFKAIAAKKKSDKSYNIAKSMKKKWEAAILQAEDTLSLTRQERVDSHFVSYAHKLNQDATPSKSAAVPKTPSSAKSKASVKTPAAVKTPSSAKGATPKTPTSAKGSKASGKSVKGDKNGTPVASKSGLPVKNYQGSNKRMSVPAGWMSKIVISDGKDQVVYISPEGVEFQSKAAMYREISLKKERMEGVLYLKDSSLPVGWRCQQIHSSVYFFSPLGERFDSRSGVAERMKTDPKYTPQDIEKVLAVEKSRKPAPKSVLIARGQYPLQNPDASDDSSFVYLPGGLTYRSGGPFDAYLDCDKIFGSSNDRLIEIAQLPYIFLEHPTVKVEDMGNEMIISDMQTGEFLAKKIIYD